MLTAFYEFLIWAALILLSGSLGRAVHSATSRYAESRALDRQATIEYERHCRRQNYFY